MGLIERNQKLFLLEEAAKKGITNKQISTISQIFSKLVGQSDIGYRNFGTPLAPLYLAKEHEEINLPKIENYLSGLYRDVQVLDKSASDLENQIQLISLEFWIRSQMIKNRALRIASQAEAENGKTQAGGRWVFSDSLNTTEYIDMSQTTAWIDTNEGLASLPEKTTKSNPIKDTIFISDSALTNGAIEVSSSPQNMIDGDESSSWLVVMNRENSEASCILNFYKEVSINTLSIDPVGYGISIKVEIDTGKGLSPALQDIIYSKTSYPVSGSNTKKIKISFSSASSSLPKTVGIRSIILSETDLSLSSDIYTLPIRPQYSFNEIKVDLESTIPSSTRILTYWSTASGGPWNKIETNSWYSVNDSITTTKIVDFSSSFVNAGGLFKLQLPDQSINDIGGTLGVGTDQVEVSTFKKEWLSEGESPKLLQPTHFDQQIITRTWTKPVDIDASTFSSHPRLLQLYNTTTLSNDPHNIERSGNILGTRKIAGQPYEEMCWAPLTGNNSGTLQPGYNYRFKFFVFCSQESYYDQGKWWFLQGHRQTNTRSFQEIGKSFGAFTMYINDSLIIADNNPYTIFTDNSIEPGAENGKSFSLKFNTGWNKIEIFWNLFNINQLIQDSNDAGHPYLQLSLMPSLFDENFQRLMNISKVLGTGEVKPVSEFDLLWNLPLDPALWAWSPTRESILFNTTHNRSIDGFFSGQFPRSILSYQGISFAQETQDIYFRFNLSRDPNIVSKPLLKNYKVMVR